MPAPQDPPKMGYVVQCSDGAPVFCNESYERCVERMAALIKGECQGVGIRQPFYRIVEAEAE